MSIQTVPGRDGDLLTFNNRRNSFQQDFNIVFYGSYGQISEAIEKMKNDFFVDQKFHDIKITSDLGYIYKGAFLSAIPVTWATNSPPTLVVSFNMMPYKYLTTGQSYQTVTNNQILNNTGTIPAKPVIKLTGSGDCTVKIGKASATLKGVDGGIIMDSDSQLCTNLAGSRTQFDKMYGDFIEIAKGNQTVKITGKNITKVEILPRWAVRC